MQPDAVKELAWHLVEEELSARRYAKESRTLVRHAMREFFRWASRRGTPDVRAFGKRELVAYRAALARQVSRRTGTVLAADTVNGRFRVVCLLFACLYRAGGIPENPTHGLGPGMPRPTCWKRRPLTRDEVTRFLEAIDTGSPQGFKDRTLFELIYSSGLRVHEAAGLKVGDIDFERRLMVVRGKFDRDRVVPISDVASDFLARFLGDKLDCPDAWVFQGYKGHLTSMYVSERFRELLRRFGMDAPDISTHSLRHSTATHLLENGASIRHVQELLGHRNIESTVRYTHVMTDGLAFVHRKHHPREHELFEVVDEAYRARLATLVNPDKGE